MVEPATWHSLHRKALRFRFGGNNGAAIVFLEQALAAMPDVPEPKNEKAIIFNTIADCCLREGLFEKGETAVRQAIQLTKDEPILHAPNLLILARILRGQHRQREAEDAGREGLRLVRQEYGWTHEYTASVENLLRQLGISFTSGWFLGVVPPRVTSFFAELPRLMARPRSR